MDKTCIFIDKIAAWLSSSSNPPICFAALHRARSVNTPTPLVGLGYLAKGNYGTWQVGNEPWELPCNHLYVGCCHQGCASPVPKEPVELWAVAFSAEKAREFNYLWDTPIRETTYVKNPLRLTSAFQKVTNLFIERQAKDPLFMKAAILELLAVAKCEFSSSVPNSPVPLPVKRALDWMSHHFHEPDISLEEIANSSELSLHHFGRIFLKATGQSTMNYLRELRIRHSCSLLQGTELRINEIAYEVGFKDPLHFSRVFHVITGKSPKQYRQESQL